MREIKFRGKRLADGVWTFGWLAIEPDGTAWISRYHRRGEWEQIEPSTVGEFTGLKDCNGLDIYEGDILKDSPDEYFEDSEQLFIVKWFGEYCGFTFHRNNTEIYENSSDLMGISNSSVLLELIGNIYENPELLEVAKI